MKRSHCIALSALMIFSLLVVGVWMVVAGDEAPPKSSSLPPLKVDKNTAPRLDGDKKPATTSSKSGLPPLRVDKNAPRLDDGGKKNASGKPKADNTACFVCHGNYQGEELAEKHAAGNIGCMSCHGPSVAHRNDEDHRTPPDVMFASKDISKACAKCHETHDVAAVKVIQRWKEKCPARTDTAEMVCTDCHGEHRMKFRSYWWDKKTREYIIPKPGEPRIKPGIDLTKPKK
jgi:hypothetical protein